jgi:hypothetical protein
MQVPPRQVKNYVDNIIINDSVSPAFMELLERRLAMSPNAGPVIGVGF